MSTTVYHDPARSTSRKTLAIIRASGTEPTVHPYLRTPPMRAQLRCLA